MTSFNELTDIIKMLNHNITNHEIVLLKKKLMQIELQYSDNPTMAPLLRMMQSLVKYLVLRKDKAHPDSIPVMLSIASQFENMINHSGSDPDKNKDGANRIISEEIQKYKTLQRKINSKLIVTDSDLNNLKAVILTIDWEISDHSLQHFEKVVTNCLSIYQQKKIYQNFLKIIQSLGHYIGSRKVNAHPDAISFLRSVFDNFEKVVQTPGMSYQNQKEILEKTINRFYELKIRISKEKKKTTLSVDNIEEKFLPPALSHIKTASKIPSGDVTPITTLSELDGSKFKNVMDDTDTLKPALSDKERPPSAPRDVMGDLFSLKESPADELLDAIHLMDVHGSDQGRTSPMLDRNVHSLSSGIKQFTPELKNNKPISEIEDRLNDFFNLESSSETSIRQMPHIPDQLVELTAEPEEDKTEGIVPFQYEDESFEQNDDDDDDDDDDDKRQKKEWVPDILGRLKTFMDTLDTLNPEPDFLSIKNDVFKLKHLLLNDPEKTSMLELFILTLQLLEKSMKTPVSARRTVSHQGKHRIPLHYRKDSPGIFARIKALFTS